MSSFDTPSAIIGLELDGKGFDEANTKLDQQARGWERVEQSVGRVAGHMDRIGGHLTSLALGVTAVGMISKTLNLEDIASRAALTGGQIGGPATYGAYRDAMRAAGIATSMDSRQLGAASQGIVGQVGIDGMARPQDWGNLSQALGHYSRAYGVDVGALGAMGGQLDLFQKLRAPDTGVLLATIAAQAGAAGKSGQVAQWLDAIGGTTSALGMAHPMMTGPGTSQSMGALYGAVSKGNPIFQDPGMFQQGVMGIDGALTGAYQNPRLQASLQMAGVGYWDQRGGLSGKNGASMAKKVLSYSERQYGKGTIEQDLFLRNQFGDVSADMLHAFADGDATYDQLKGTNPTAGTYDEIQERSKANQDTPGARLQRAQEDVAKHLDPTLAGILDYLGIDSASDAAVAIASAWGGKKLLGKGGKKLFGKLKGTAGKRAAAGATGAAADAGAAGAAGKLAKYGRWGLKGGVITTAAGILLDPGDLGDEDQLRLNRMTGRMRDEFGDDWASDQDARGWAVKQFNLHGRQGRITRTMGDMFDAGGTNLTASAAAGVQMRAAEKLEKAAQHLMEINPNTGQPQYKGAAYRPGDPQGLSGSTASQVGANMVLARTLSPSSSGSGGGGGALAQTQMVSMGIDPSGSSSSDSGGGGGGGGGSWSACTLTWYDPALGGINSGNGQADPHHPMANGQPYQASGMTCAAPKGYEFGTKIEFKYGDKTVTCTVTDRGGAINGSHFDLSRGAANKIGMLGAGQVTGKFRVLGGGSSSKSSNSGATAARAPGGGGGGAGGSAGWMAGAGAAASAAASRLGGGGGVQVHVNIDGRETERTKRLVRG